jgi:hypothetical protein
MMGASLSRWTMSCFAAALVTFVAAQVLMVSGYGYPATPLRAPETLFLVHLTAIGWLSLLMMGALFQFVPVLVAKPLRDPALVLPAVLCVLCGLVALLAGFLQMAGTIEPGLPLLAWGGSLLVCGFSLAIWLLARTLWQARPLGLSARFVATGLASLAAAIILGFSFALALSGAVDLPFAVALDQRAVPFHATAGIAGWLTFTAIGVTYRLLPMFMLAPEGGRAASRAAWLLGSAALALVVVVAPAAALAGAGERTLAAMAWVAGFCGCAAVVFYGGDLAWLYRKRKRRAVELNIRASVGAFAALLLALLLLAALAATGRLVEHAGALVYLVAFGWLSGLGLSQLYKIVPFLTWLECYGPVMGRKPTPRVQDLVVERRDTGWFVLYFLGVYAGTAALLAGRPEFFRVAAAATLAATLALIVEFILARRLANVAAAARLPEGTRLPRLFVAGQRQG